MGFQNCVKTLFCLWRKIQHCFVFSAFDGVDYFGQWSWQILYLQNGNRDDSCNSLHCSAPYETDSTKWDCLAQKMLEIHFSVKLSTGWSLLSGQSWHSAHIMGSNLFADGICTGTAHMDPDVDVVSTVVDTLSPRYWTGADPDTTSWLNRKMGSSLQNHFIS